jgi:putative CocE/NonD family hydrolase
MRAALSLLALACYANASSIPDDGALDSSRRRKNMDFMLPMSDGVNLHTKIYFPRDSTSPSGDGKFPVVMDRSPYGYGDLEWIPDIFLPFGFVAVGQDVRGTEKSEGDWNMFINEADDSEELGNWIVEQEWSNGEIYTFGMSADGIASIQTIENNPSWLKGQYVGWAPARLYEVLFPHGAYKQKTTEDWVSDLDMTDEDHLPELLKLIHENENHNSSFWDQVEMDDEKYANVAFPNAFWAGWYDLFQSETIALYNGYNEKSDASVARTSRLVIDPVGHCLEAQTFWTENVVYGRTGVMLAQVFETFGIVEQKRSAIKNVTFYVMSSNDDKGKEAGQFWTSLEKFPDFTATDYFLHAEGAATTSPQSSDETESTAYVYDPSNPVPTIGGNNLPASIGGTIPCGPLDQRPGEDGRDDVLKFDTDVQDEPLYITGPLSATLFVSSDVIDTDFSVKISDVYPTGEVIILQDNTFRMRWRSKNYVPDVMMKDEVYEINVNLWNTSYVVAPEHKLRISISSSNYPRFSVNPNNGVLLKDDDYPGVNVTANNVIHHSEKYQSKITLPVVKKRDIPKVRVLKEVEESYGITKEMIERVVEGAKR